MLDFIILSIYPPDVSGAPPDLIELAMENGCRVYLKRGESFDTTDKLVPMKHAYAAKVDGIAIWDLNNEQASPEKWAVCSRLGHQDEVMALPEPEKYPKMNRLKLRSIRGRDFAHTTLKGAWLPRGDAGYIFRGIEGGLGHAC